MFILLVIFTFVAGILLDHFITRRHILIATEAPERRLAGAALPRRTADVVGGFTLPENLSYHIGHTWAVAEAPQLVRVGADDLAAKTAGHLTAVDLPERGKWVRQGQKIVAMHRDGREIELVSPIEGTVVSVNDKLRLDPDLARKDPYGEGWLIAVNAPDVATSFRNLLNGNVARRWMEESAAALRTFSPSALAMVAQDGGVALDDLAANLPDAEFKMLTNELFLT